MSRGSRQVPERGPRLRSRPAPRARRSPRSTQQRHTHRRPRRLSSREVCTSRARGPGGIQGGRASPGRGCFGAWLGGGGRPPGAGPGRGGAAAWLQAGWEGNCDQRGSLKAGRGEAGPRGAGARRTRGAAEAWEKAERGGYSLFLTPQLHIRPQKGIKTTYRTGDNICRSCS